MYVFTSSHLLKKLDPSAMVFSLKPNKCVLALAVFSFVLISCSATDVCTNPKHHKSAETSDKNGDSPINREGQAASRPRDYYLAGSSLPDCSHACGPCFPCKRVLVSFKCHSMSESCPIVYRCMCKGKFYHIPSAH